MFKDGMSSHGQFITGSVWSLNCKPRERAGSSMDFMMYFPLGIAQHVSFTRMMMSCLFLRPDEHLQHNETNVVRIFQFARLSLSVASGKKESASLLNGEEINHKLWNCPAKTLAVPDEYSVFGNKSYENLTQLDSMWNCHLRKKSEVQHIIEMPRW